jgi:alkylhydroperoxidase family enzyme
VQAVLADVATAPIPERLRAMLVFLAKVSTTPEALTKADGAALKAAGVSRADAQDALWVAWQFAVFTRMADTLGFSIPDDGFAMAPKILLSPIGYR